MKKKILLMCFIYITQSKCGGFGSNIVENVLRPTEKTQAMITDLYGLAYEVNERVGDNVRALNIAVPQMQQTIDNTQETIQHLHANEEITLQGLVEIEQKLCEVLEKQNNTDLLIQLINHMISACIEHEAYTAYVQEIREHIINLQSDSQQTTDLLKKIDLFLKVLELKQTNERIRFKEWCMLFAHH